VAGQVGSLGQILADEAIGVLVAAALPRAVGIAEVDFDAGVGGQLCMARHFSAPVIGEGFGHRFGDVLKGPFKGAAGGLGIQRVHAVEQDEAAGALGQCANGRTVGCALDKVAFPVAGDQPALDVFGPLCNPAIIGDEALPAVCTA
jgi:hypothetical protein